MSGLWPLKQITLVLVNYDFTQNNQELERVLEAPNVSANQFMTNDSHFLSDFLLINMEISTILDHNG